MKKRQQRTHQKSHQLNVFVTGANGFIGRAVVKQLVSSGYGVRAFVREPIFFPFVHDNLEVVKGDVCDSKKVLLAMKGMNACVHLAARKSDEEDSYAVNVVGTKNVLAACKKNNVRLFVQVSTLSTKIAQKGMYAQTKDLADQLVLKSRIPSVVLKPSIVYGELSEGVFGSLVKFSQLPFIPLIGNGQQVVHPIHVKDLAQVIEKIIEHRQHVQGKVFDVGGPTALTLEDFIRVIERKVHRKNNGGKVIHIPLWVGMMLAKLMNKIMKKPLLTVSNILGSTQDIPIMVEPLFSAIHWKPRRVEKAIMDLPSFDLLDEEIRELWKYVTTGIGRPEYPTEQDLKDARTVFTLNNATHTLPKYLFSVPLALGSADFFAKLFFPYSPLQQKLLLISALVETSPRSAGVLLPKQRSITQFIFQCIAIGLQTAFYAVGSLGWMTLFLMRKRHAKNL